MRFVLPLLVFSILACSGSTPLTEFKVQSAEVDASCTKLTDFCVRVSCTVKNVGKVPGQAVVDIQLQDQDGKVLFSETERADLGPGDTHQITHDFTQVKLGTEAKGQCLLR